MRFRDTLTVLLCLVSTGVLFECGAAVAQSPTVKNRWAIVALTPEARGLADLLTAELSDQDDVELLERERIREVLGELQINASGLVAPGMATRFGSIGQAQALVMISVPQHNKQNPPNLQKSGKSKNEAAALRVRLVDTRTSVRLIDAILPSQRLDASVRSIADQLKQAKSILNIPLTQMQLVGLIPIRSGEPGRYLNSFCRTLSTLLEVQLHQVPGLIVVERSELQRLISEADVSGLPLEIRGAARMIEASLRRADNGKGMLVTCRLTSPGTGGAETFELTVQSQNITTVRQAFVEKLTEKLGSKPLGKQQSLETEALIFDHRRDLFDDNRRGEDATEMAEAALALAPTPERLSTALRHLRHTAENARDWQDRFAAGMRYQELRLSWLQKTKPDEKMWRVASGSSPLATGLPYGPAIRLPSRSGHVRSPDDQQATDEWYDIGRQIYDYLYAEADTPMIRFRLLAERLSHAGGMAKTEAEYTKLVSAINGSMQDIIDSTPIPEKPNSVEYTKYTFLLIRAVDVVEQRRKYRRRPFSPPQPVSSRLHEPSDLTLNIGHAEEPAVRTAELYRKAYYTANPATIREMLEVADGWQLSYSPRRISASFDRSLPVEIRRTRSRLVADGNYETYRLRRLLADRLSKANLRQYIEDMIQHASDTNEAGRLLQIADLITRSFHKFSPDQRRNLAVKISSLLETVPLPERSTEVARLRAATRPWLPKLERMPAVSFEGRTGEWKRYTKNAIPLRDISKENFQLKTVHVDRRDDARERGGELMLVWGRRHDQLSVERVSLQGGKPVAVGPPVPGSGFRDTIRIAVSPDAVFVTSETYGFTMLKRDSFEVFTEEHGAPAGYVRSMAWYRGRLYLGYTDSIASFDPQSKSFQLVASGTSIVSKNPLDGRGGFFPRHLFADEANKCLWVNIQDNAIPYDTNGIWKFDPASGTLTRHTNFHTTPNDTDRGILLNVHTGDRRLQIIDDTSPVPRLLTDYALFHQTSAADLALVGDDIITRHGILFTNDGNEYRVRPDGQANMWPLMHAVRDGFIVDYDTKSKSLICIKKVGS